MLTTRRVNGSLHAQRLSSTFVQGRGKEKNLLECSEGEDCRRKGKGLYLSRSFRRKGDCELLTEGVQSPTLRAIPHKRANGMILSGTGEQECLDPGFEK